MGDFQLFQLAAKMTLVGIPTTAGFRGLYIVGLHDLVGFHRIGFHRVALNLVVNQRSDYRKCRCFLSSIIIYHHLPSFIWISMLGKYFFPHTCHVVFFKFPSFLSHPLEAAELLDPGSWHPASSAWPRHPSVPLGSLPPGNTELPAEHGVGLLCLDEPPAPAWRPRSTSVFAPDPGGREVTRWSYSSWALHPQGIA